MTTFVALGLLLAGQTTTAPASATQHASLPSITYAAEAASNDWATAGVEHVYFAAVDLNGDRFEDIVTIGGDRKLYWTQSVSGWKAAPWKPVREELVPEGVVGMEGGGGAVLLATATRVQILRGIQLAVEREIEGPAGRQIRALHVSEREIRVELENGEAASLGEFVTAGAAPTTSAASAESQPSSAPVASRPSWTLAAVAPPAYQPDAPLVRQFAGDVSGDGIPDAIGVFRASRFGEHLELRVAVTANPTSGDSDGDGLPDEREAALSSNPLDRDTDDDGLLDGWEVLGLPRNVDAGANTQLSPIRQDVIVAAALYEQVDRAAFERELPRVKDLYRGLSCHNPDGSTGVEVHVRFDAPVLKEQQLNGGWAEVGAARFPLAQRGMLHWMQVTPWGGGQAMQTGDMGGCGAGYAVFAHEFGHQLGLSHTGDSAPAWCPLYPSLMSYAFSYSLNGDASAIRFSDGRFRDTVLNEEQLNEKLPYPFDALRYLAAPPFRYKLADDGAGGTLIDWNHNGTFDEGPVSADINYGGSTDCGERMPLEQIGAGPALAYVGAHCCLVTLDQSQSVLSIQQYLGAQKWTDKKSIPGAASTREPLLVGTATHGYVFYWAPQGWFVARFAAPAPPADGSGNGHLAIENPFHLADLPRAELSAGRVVVAGPDGAPKERLLLVGRRDDDRLETFWLDFTDKYVVTRGRELELRSQTPVGMAQSPADKRIVLASSFTNSRGAPLCMRVTYFDLAGDNLVERETLWTRGEASGNSCVTRPVVFFTDVGELNIVHTAMPPANGLMTAWRTRRVGNLELDEGWLTCLLYDVWTATRCPVAFANGPQGAIYAFRWDADGWTKNNTLLMCYRGLGISSEPMRDFNDGEKVSRFGLTHSILWMQPE